MICKKGPQYYNKFLIVAFPYTHVSKKQKGNEIKSTLEAKIANQACTSAKKE